MSISQHSHQIWFPSELESRQIHHNLPPSNPSSPPQSREVQSAAQTIGKSKEQHGWDPSSRILQSKASLFHLVLLDGSTVKMVNASLRVDFRLKGSWSVGELSSNQNVEIVVSCVTAGVTFSSDGGACI